MAAAIAVVAAGAIGLAAQTTEVKSKTKTQIKDGKDITTAGCVEPSPTGGFVLTSERGGEFQYVLVGKENWAKYVGERVEVSGKATDRGDATVKTETRTKTQRTHGKDEESHSKTETRSDVGGPPILGVKSVKSLGARCE